MQQISKLILRIVVALVLWGVGPLAASAQALRNTFAGGGGHSLSIHADGTLWATGNNSDGQLGDNTTVNKTTWIPIGTDTDWVQVAAGQNHSLALKANGTLYAWGDNAQGQLGSGTTTDSYTPTAVVGGGTYTQLAAGYYHSLGLRQDGTLYAWGDNDQSQLGDGTTADKPVPTAVAGGGTYTRIAAGFYHSLGLRSNGTLWAWGLGSSGQLGMGTTATQPVPAAVAGGHVFVQLAAGAYFSLGLRQDGRIYSWGANNLNQLGNGTTVNGLAPAAVSGSSIYSQVAAGGFHGLGLRSDGVLETWGQNAEGQIGNNSKVTAMQPTIVMGNGTYVQAVGGQNHSLGLRADGTLYTWGDNTKGQLGDPASNSYLYLPTALGAALPTRSTAAGGAFGLAIKGDGTLWSWGDNAFGQLGDGTTTDRTRPMQVGAARTWIQVVAGNRHALGLQANGSLWAWGDNSLGQLGNGTSAATPTTTPVLVSIGPYVRLAAGEAYSLALQATGTLFAWGSNDSGQLGSATNAGTTTPNPTPALVPGQYAYVAAGAAHALALQANGILYAWGANASGQLGTTANVGTPAPNPTPTALGAGVFTQVAAGQAHSLALQATGTLYSWGANDSGQLGSIINVGTTAPNTVPTSVAGQYAHVAAGYARTLARRANGTIWAWGADDNGQLGLGTTTATAVSTPTQEATQATNWTTLAAGPLSKSSLVRTPSAQSFASAGLNDEGQLGDGTNTDAPRFDRVILLSAAAPLPVTLVSFEARRTAPATVALAWATATETNNAGFTVQKSTDGVAFSALGFVAGAGTSAMAHAYTYTDSQAPGRSYYRLAQQDADGTTAYSPVAVVEGAATSLALAPNPARGAVQVLGLAPDATLVVYDGLGRAVRTAAATLDVTGLPAGIYLVRATAPHQAPQTARLVVE